MRDPEGDAGTGTGQQQEGAEIYTYESSSLVYGMNWSVSAPSPAQPDDSLATATQMPRPQDPWPVVALLPLLLLCCCRVGHTTCCVAHTCASVCSAVQCSAAVCKS